MSLKISIIVATYNSSKTIRSCLDSIFNQNYSNIEINLIDGKSSDNTLDIVKNYNRKIPIKIISEEDNGIYDALNKGIYSSIGDVIGFVHSDDILASSTIFSEIIKKISLENFDGVYGDLQYVDFDKTDKVIRNWKSCDFNDKLLKKGWMPAHPTFFLKKAVYDKHGSFNLNYSISSDYDFMIRVLNDNSLKFCYLPRVISKMRVGGSSNRSLKNILKKSREDYIIIKKNKVGNFITLVRKNLLKINQYF
ncbi:MAG: glycosyl transferase [Flavobacteriales bacterium]|nr:glycosyl transferase [Flavobacteriales bacterium]|tara:strand:- start:727 stop:1476 length:750 start_codon:yes stop_codon:yes gene_type:complete